MMLFVNKVFKKLTVITMTAMLMLALLACQDISTTTEEKTTTMEEIEMTLVSTIKKTPSEKTYFSVLDQPFLMLGAQIRLDGLLNRPEQKTHDKLGQIPEALSMEEIETYFRHASDFGFNTLQVPIDWRWIEPSKDDYDFHVLDRILAYAVQYDIKIEILWFSTNMCGDSHSFHLPDYIFWDKETYPRIQMEFQDGYVDEIHTLMYGYSGYLVLNNPDLMEREYKALHTMMNHIAQWNTEHGHEYPVIGVQIHNESDGFLRWRVDQGNLRLNKDKLTKRQAWDMTLDALDNAGNAVKESNYVVVTRTNMTVSLSMGAFPQYAEASPMDVLALEGIDIVGDDPYVQTTQKIKQSILAYKSGGNYPHIAENMGNYPTTPALILTAVVLGGAYNIYDFATPEYFIWMNEGSDYQMDQGILNPDFSPKDHSDLTNTVISGIKKAGHLMPLVDSENIAGFNLAAPAIKENVTQTIQTSRVAFTFKTEDGALAYAVEYGDSIYVWGSASFELKMDNVELFPYAETGYMDGMTFVDQGKVYPAGDFYSLAGQTFYRFEVKSFDETMTSSTVEAIG